MEKINIMVNGLPGNVATKMAIFAIQDDRFNLVPFSLTGAEIEEETIVVNDLSVSLVQEGVRDDVILKINSEYKNFICIDYTHPTAVNSNASFYLKNNTPFVMGTTGGDRKRLEQDVRNGAIPAVIAPNMAKQIVGFQAMLEYAAQTFPDLFEGYTLEVEESHQKGKADTSGTAKIIVEYFNQLGLDFNVQQIEQIRDPKTQEETWGIPKEHLAGHGWHTYTLRSDDNTVLFQFKHNINGRDIYVNGTFDAALFLNNILKTHQDTDKRIYTMIDVLKENKA
jgi:4-hydroxy-tetrahydrodipicolinate reductase